MGSAKKLLAQRAQILRAVARYREFIEGLDSENLNVYELKARKEKLAHLWDNFESVQSEIELNGNNGPENEELRKKFEIEYFGLLGKTDELLVAEKLQVKTVGAECAQVTDEGDKVKLPPVDIKKFSGKFEEWLPFYNLFKSMVHENKNLGDLQKFHYLRSYLVDGAADVINDLELTSENYGEAWNLLKERYDNRRLIIQNHIKTIFEAPVVAKENAVALRNFIDYFKRHLRALKSLKSDAGESSDLLIYFVLSKLDTFTVREWENRQKRESKVSIDDLLKFLSEKCETLELIKKPVVTQQGTPIRRVQSASASSSPLGLKCSMCRENHSIVQCSKFKNLSPDEKYRKVLSKGLCMNCLKVGSHLAKDCFSPGCKLCKGKHHELLHEKFTPVNTVTSANCMSGLQMKDQIMLSTVNLEIFGADGRKYNCRALLDSGSQSDFITERLVEKLGLKKHNLNMAVVGIGSKSTRTFEQVEVTIKSRINNYRITLKPLILRQITDALPVHTFDKKLIKIPKNLILADPEFNTSGEIDLLIGAHHFWMALNEKNITLKGQPRLQDTKFGWIVAGGWGSFPQQKGRSISNAASSEPFIDLSRFWELEDIRTPSEFTIEEKYCMAHFEKTYTRDETGRFIVELPVRQEKLALLGDNRETALKRFYSLEHRLNKNPKLKEEYIKFMKEYERLGHMAEVTEDSAINSSVQSYYIPHHCVINENSMTTKLRVVFDASSKDTGGISLNEVLMTGPVLQQDLFSLMVRFRSHKYVLTSDIRKMYRQVKITEHQTSLQKIFWRETPHSKLKIYQLLTVTYGTASASFLAIRALQELAKLEGSNYPLGAKVALRDFYVDDLITGANTKEELLTIRNEITALLAKGGMELAKWCTNVPELLPKLDPNLENGISFDKNSNFRTLGVKWWPVTDEFGYTVQGVIKPGEIITKRSILSTIARVFDPLGWIGPYIVIAKILLQKLWELKLDWDEEVPVDIQGKWKACLSQIISLENIRIPRLIICENFAETEIHGFCDASEDAYGACVYLRSMDKKGGWSSHLICSKSRVSPIKAISLPRLELCAAVLLTNLIKKVKSSLEFSNSQVFCWTDSKIVLAWLNSNSKKWSVFVAHRVGMIQENIPSDRWSHVPSDENPADIISRGYTKGALESVRLWWEGPEWLYDGAKPMPKGVANLRDEEIPEVKRVVAKVITRSKSELWERYGTYKRLVRIVAYLKRFLENCKRKREERQSSILNSKEYEVAETTLIKIVQAEEYSEELNLLQKGSSVPRQSKLIHLNPFLDENQIIRVGGRLQNSDLPFSQKHPIILPGKHQFTRLLLLHEHERLLHTGAETTLSVVREKFWPVGVKSFLRALIRNCVICRKASPILAQHLMGSLPKQRTEYSKPFETAGVDYCGPFLIKESKRRNSKTSKIWVVVFVCFSVKAVHLEIATDLTAEGFVNALKRFVARRGMVKTLFSDNATNFAAASKELNTIEWIFTPPRAPHFGGLWEAAVKAFKMHFKKVVGQQLLTYKEFNTLLISIEAVLNTRPLVPLSEDVNDLSCLTPAHFLVGDSLMAIPTHQSQVKSINLLKRWRLIQEMKEVFLKRWHADYLRTCQVRSKWTAGARNLEVGQVVQILEDNMQKGLRLGELPKFTRVPTDWCE